MKKLLGLLLLCVPPVCYADNGQDTTAIRTTYVQDTLWLGEDSVAVIETLCAPICSSVVRIYNKVWLYLGDLSSPFAHAVFPEAYVENGRILWRDNTGLMLDDEEKKK